MNNPFWIGRTLNRRALLGALGRGQAHVGQERKKRYDGLLRKRGCTLMTLSAPAAASTARKMAAINVLVNAMLTGEPRARNRITVVGSV